MVVVVFHNFFPLSAAFGEWIIHGWDGGSGAWSYRGGEGREGWTSKKENKKEWEEKRREKKRRAGEIKNE